MRIYSTESYPGQIVAVTVEWQGYHVRVERTANGWQGADGALPNASMWDDFWEAWHTDSDYHGIPINDIYTRS